MSDREYNAKMASSLRKRLEGIEEVQTVCPNSSDHRHAIYSHNVWAPRFPNLFRSVKNYGCLFCNANITEEEASYLPLKQLADIHGHGAKGERVV